MTEKLTAKTVQGLKWTYLVSAVSLVLQVALTAIMARLLAPDSYGLVALAYTVIKFGTFFAQMGIAPALIRQRELTPVDKNTGFLVSTIAGTCLFLLVWLTAPLVADLFDDNRIIPLIQIASLSFIFGGVAVCSQALLRRLMKFGAISLIDLVSFVLGPVATGLVLALMDFGAVSLVWGFVVQSLVLSLITYPACGHKFRLEFGNSSFERLFCYGGKHSIVSFLEFVTYTIDTILIGALLGAKALGIYNRASYLIQIPSQVLNNAVGKIAFPALSSANTDEDRLGRAYLSTFLFIGIAIFPLCFGASVAAPEIVAVMLGPNWSEADNLVRILAIAIPFHLMLHVHGTLFDVKAALRQKFLIRLAHLITLLGLYLALARFGLVGFAFAFLATELVFFHIYGLIVLKASAVNSKSFYRYYRVILSVAVFTALLIWLTTWLCHGLDWSPVITLIAQIAAGAAALGIQVVLFPSAHFCIDLADRIENGFTLNQTVNPLSRFLNWYIARLKNRQPKILQVSAF